MSFSSQSLERVVLLSRNRRNVCFLSSMSCRVRCRARPSPFWKVLIPVFCNTERASRTIISLTCSRMPVTFRASVSKKEAGCVFS